MAGNIFPPAALSWPRRIVEAITDDLRQLPLSKSVLALTFLFSFSLPLAVSLFVHPLFFREIIGAIEDEASRLAQHVDRSLGSPVDTAALADIPPQKKSAIAFLVRDFGIMKLRLFAPDGLIVYSTQEEETGRIHANDDFSAFIRAKKTYSKVVDKNHLTYDGVPVKKTVVEVYLPLMRGKKIIGALEIYYDISERLQKIEHFLSLSLALLAFGATLFFCTCFVLIRRLQKNIVKRRQMETFLQGIIDQMDDKILVLDPDRRVRWMNRAARQNLPVETKGFFCHTVTHGLNRPCDGGDHPCPFPLARQNGKTAVTLHVHREIHGTTGMIEHSATPLHDKDGAFAGIIEQIHDRTETIVREKMERRRQSQEALERIAAGIGHDFSNLFTALLGNIRLAQIQAKGMTDDLETSLNEAATAGRQAAALTAKLVSFARDGDPDRGPVSVAALIEEEKSRLLAGFPGITVEIVVPASLWSVYVHAPQVGDVVFNVFLNAAEALKGKGLIQVAATNLLVGDEDPPSFELAAGCYVRLDITDRGCGILAAHEEIVFDPYFSTKPKGAVKGTGLGLTLCHAIVKRHGGAITFVSIPGEQTTFSLFFPARQPATADRGAA